MNEAALRVLLEIDSRAAGSAYHALRRRAGGDVISVLFEPDTMMAVDRPGRRGFLYDEVYFITVWASVRGDHLLEILNRDTDQVDRPTYVSMTSKDGAERPQPEHTLAFVLEHGTPIDHVRHLI